MHFYSIACTVSASQQRVQSSLATHDRVTDVLFQLITANLVINTLLWLKEDMYGEAE